MPASYRYYKADSGADGEREPDVSADDWIAFYTFWLVVFTAVLSVSTIGLWLATISGARRQAEDTKAALNIAQISAEAAGSSAKAAHEANILSRDNFVATQRPWIVADISVGGPLKYDQNGVAVTMRIRLRNIGHSPATNVWVHPKMMAPALGVDDSYNPIATQRTMIQEMKSRPAAAWGDTIFPGTPTEYLHTVSIGSEELKRIASHVEFLHLEVIGVVDYRFVFGTESHQTGFSFLVRRTPRPDAAAKKRAPDAIFIDDGDIAASDLLFVSSPIGGDYAD
jgi:hypothetical protein